jgi:hypothetical protein
LFPVSITRPSEERKRRLKLSQSGSRGEKDAAVADDRRGLARALAAKVEAAIIVLRVIAIMQHAA